MPKIISILVVSSVVAGASLLGESAPPTPDLLELGVTWDEATLRAAVPPGFDLAAGATGGIAVRWAPDGAASGFAWADVAYGTGARFVIGTLDEGTRTGEGRLALTLRAGRERLDLVVEPDPAYCRAEAVALGGPLFGWGAEGELETRPADVVRDRCDAAVVAMSAAGDGDTPFGRALGSLSGGSVRWAEVATGLGVSP